MAVIFDEIVGEVEAPNPTPPAAPAGQGAAQTPPPAQPETIRRQLRLLAQRQARVQAD